jgi:glutamine---fructose-6-phosphate transaminase (isomerizing)
MTRFLEDILRQRQELTRAIEYVASAGSEQVRRAVSAIRRAQHVYLTGIGSSWNATFGAGAIFYRAGRPVYMQNAGELVQFAAFPRDAAVMAISRSGRSVEIVKLLAKARAANATVIGITNSADGELAHEAQIPIVVPAKLDHAVSVVTYSTLAFAAAAVAQASMGSFDSELGAELRASVVETERRIPGWREQIAASTWFVPGRLAHFLARGGSLGTCYEAQLLWEEAAKTEATARGTDSLRHGPQEMVTEGSRFGMWLDAEGMRMQDLSVARDLRRLGASLFLVGQDVPVDAGELVIQLPSVPPEWQFMIDIIPAQLAAENLAGLAGVDCDSFRVCSYIVEEEYGLGSQVPARKDGE